MKDYISFNKRAYDEVADIYSQKDIFGVNQPILFYIFESLYR